MGQGRWEPWVGGGAVRGKARALASWAEWVRDYELFAGTMPCPGAEFPGPARALRDLEQTVVEADEFARVARWALRRQRQSCRKGPREVL